MVGRGYRLAEAVSLACQEAGAVQTVHKTGLSVLPNNRIVLTHINRTNDLEVKVSVFEGGETQVFIGALSAERRPDYLRHMSPYLSIYFGQKFAGVPELHTIGDVGKWAENPLVLNILKAANTYSNGRLKRRLLQLREEKLLIGHSKQFRQLLDRVLLELEA